MATAVETGSEPRTPSPPMSLPIASLLGAVYVVAAVAGVFYAVPTIWKDSISPLFGGFTFVNVAVRLAVQLTVAGGLIWFGRKLLGDTPPKGIRGGIFLMIAFAAISFFLWRWVALSVDGTPGMIISGLIAAFLLYLAVRFFTGKTGERWMVGLEEQGWFHGNSYKRTLGQKVRRLTILGILIIGGTGVYSLMFQGLLPENWTLAMPFELPSDHGADGRPVCHSTSPARRDAVDRVPGRERADVRGVPDRDRGGDEQGVVDTEETACPGHRGGADDDADPDALPSGRGLVLGLAPEPFRGWCAARRRPPGRRPIGGPAGQVVRAISGVSCGLHWSA